MLIKIPKNEHEKVIIGGDLNSFLRSYQDRIPLIINKLAPPHRFETIETYNARDVWNKLFFTLSVSGLNLVGDTAKSVRIKENEISISTSGARVFKCNANKLLIFDDENVSGLPLPTKETENFIVLDWMFARSCEKHTNNYLNTNDNFVNEIYFYPTERLDGHHPDNKDLVAISHLNKEQLNDFEYSDTYAKFKVTKMLKDLGIKGKKNSPNHYALKLEVERREVKKAKMNLYENSEQMEFIYEPPKRIAHLYQGIV